MFDMRLRVNMHECVISNIREASMRIVTIISLKMFGYIKALVIMVFASTQHSVKVSVLTMSMPDFIPLDQWEIIERLFCPQCHSLLADTVQTRSSAERICMKCFKEILRCEPLQ